MGGMRNNSKLKNTVKTKRLITKQNYEICKMWMMIFNSQNQKEYY
jgi:hypothetical protein